MSKQKKMIVMSVVNLFVEINYPPLKMKIMSRQGDD